MNATEAVQYVNEEWRLRDIPEEERPAALKWAGGIDRLARWMVETKLEAARARVRLQAQSASPERIRRVADMPGTVLDVARREGLPEIVVRYWRAGCPTIDTGRRPWL